MAMLRRVMLLSLGALSCLVLGACSSDEETPPDTRAGDIRTNDVWKNGMQLTGTVRIIAPAVVEIEAGATIRCSKGTQIQIGGTLRKAAGARSKITCTEWDGLVVAQAGTLSLEDFDLENAKVGIQTTEGSGESTAKKTSITNSVKPFLVGKDSKLTLEDVKASAPKTVAAEDQSVGFVYGTLLAKKLDYDAQGNEGIQIRDGGSAEIEDSTVHATGGGDMVSAYKAKSLKLTYSKLSGAHCGPHIEGIDSFTIDHVTSENNTYGLTVYLAGAGPNVVSNSNLNGAAAWLDLQGDHGPITISNVFTGGGEPVIKNTEPPTIENKASAPIGDAQPR